MPSEAWPQKQEPDIQDMPFWFNKNRTTLFFEILRTKGFKVLRDTEKDGERITVVALNKGLHIVSFGFRQIDLTEQRWFHGGLDDKERREASSFKFDTNSLEFQKVNSEFKSSLDHKENLLDLVQKLNYIIQKHVKSDMVNERAHSLSEIIKTGKAACSSKSVLAGSLLKMQSPNLRVEIIMGYLGKFRNKISLPFGHEWLRISDSNACVLYDPMYDKQFYYKFGTKPEPNNPFEGYTVSALPFAKLHNLIGLTSISASLQLLEAYEENGLHYFVVSDYCTIDFQLGGQMSARIGTNEGEIEFVNGNIENDTKTNNGPRILYPLLYLEKTATN